MHNACLPCSVPCTGPACPSVIWCATTQPDTGGLPRTPATPTANPVPAAGLAVGEYYWGYGLWPRGRPRARLRYSLDRHSDQSKRIYAQRTAVERINSQAVALGIERPHFRNGCAIANVDTLTFLLINLRFLRRLLDCLPPDTLPENGQP